MRCSPATSSTTTREPAAVHTLMSSAGPRSTPASQQIAKVSSGTTPPSRTRLLPQTAQEGPARRRRARRQPCSQTTRIPVGQPVRDQGDRRGLHRGGIRVPLGAFRREENGHGERPVDGSRQSRQHLSQSRMIRVPFERWSTAQAARRWAVAGQLADAHGYSSFPSGHDMASAAAAGLSSWLAASRLMRTAARGVVPVTTGVTGVHGVGSFRRWRGCWRDRGSGCRGAG